MQNVGYAWGRLSIDARARTLVAHEDDGYEEWGASAGVAYAAKPSGSGLSPSLRPQWGQDESAAQSVWSTAHAGQIAQEDAFEGTSSLEAEFGYGFALSHGRGVLTPYAGMTLGDAGNRTVRTGTRWQLGPDTVVGLEATREASDANEGANEVRLRAALRF